MGKRKNKGGKRGVCDGHHGVEQRPSVGCPFIHHWQAGRQAGSNNDIPLTLERSSLFAYGHRSRYRATAVRMARNDHHRYCRRRFHCCCCCVAWIAKPLASVGQKRGASWWSNGVQRLSSVCVCVCVCAVVVRMPMVAFVCGNDQAEQVEL